MPSLTGVRLPWGTELVSSRLQSRDLSQTLGLLGFIAMVLTALLFGFAILWVDYTCFHVAGTLAAVENANPSTYVRLDEEDSNDTGHADIDATSKSGPITSDLISTIKHLRARGGVRSYFRGFRMYLAFSGFDMGVGLLLRIVIPIKTHTPPIFTSILGGFAISMLLATWQMAWVHLVIADKSTRTSFRRMLGLRSWPLIAPAAALYSASMCLTFFLPGASTSPVGWTVGWIVVGFFTDPHHEGFFGSLLPIICMAVLTPLISLPARAIFARVAAATLPQEDDPIVPFDRQFGGKAKPDVMGGGNRLGLRDAWTTFEWEARVRYAKIVLAAFVIEIALTVVGLLLIVGELLLVTPRSQSPASHS